MNAFIEDILSRIQDLLELAPPVSVHQLSLTHVSFTLMVVLSVQCVARLQENGFPALLSSDDQLFVFETAGVLIVSGESPAERKQALMRSLLSPLMEAFRMLLAKLPQETDEERQTVLVDCLSHAVGFARYTDRVQMFMARFESAKQQLRVSSVCFSRTSKAFSNKQTVKQCGCSEVYLDCLQTFLPALSCPVQRGSLRSAVRSFLHRMIICLEEEVLPFIPAASQHMLKDCEAKDLQEFIPLISQITAKFKVLKHADGLIRTGTQSLILSFSLTEPGVSIPARDLHASGDGHI